MVHARNTLAARTAFDALGAVPAFPAINCTLTCTEMRDLALQELPDATSDMISAALLRASQPADGTDGWVSL